MHAGVLDFCNSSTVFESRYSFITLIESNGIIQEISNSKSLTEHMTATHDKQRLGVLVCLCLCFSFQWS